MKNSKSKRTITCKGLRIPKDNIANKIVFAHWKIA
jgi:hypothetical protein